MLKRLFSFILPAIAACLISNSANAQSDEIELQKAKKALIDTVCYCVGNADTTGIKTSEAVIELMSKCFMSDGLMPFIQYATLSKVNITDEKALSEMSEKIGVELSTQCPALFKMMLKLASDPEELDKLIKMAEEQKKGL